MDEWLLHEINEYESNLEGVLREIYGDCSMWERKPEEFLLQQMVEEEAVGGEGVQRKAVFQLLFFHLGPIWLCTEGNQYYQSHMSKLMNQHDSSLLFPNNKVWCDS